MSRRSRKNCVEFSMILLFLRGSRGWHGNARSIFAIFAACWKATRGFTARLTPDLSGKAGTPCVTKGETLSRLGASRPTLNLRKTVWTADLFSDGSRKWIPLLAGDGDYETRAHFSCGIYRFAGGGLRPFGRSAAIERHGQHQRRSHRP